MHAWLCRQCCVRLHHDPPATDGINLTDASQTSEQRGQSEHGSKTQMKGQKDENTRKKGKMA